MYLKTHAKNSEPSETCQCQHVKSILANAKYQNQPLTISDTNPQSFPSLKDMRKQMPENMPDRKPLQMKTCFESLPTLEISDEKMEKSRGHSTKNTFFFGKYSHK